MVIDLVKCQKKNSELQAAIFIASKPQGNLLNQIKKLGVAIHFGMLNNGLDCSPGKILLVLKIFQHYKILHYHTFNPTIALCGVISRKQLMYTEHGNFGFGRQWTYFDKLKDYLKNIFLNTKIDHISFNSNFTKSISESRYSISAVNSSVIYNGINLKEVNISKINIDSKVLSTIKDKFVIGTSSRFARFKRIDRLITGFANFQHNRNTILLLVGDGPLKNELINKVKELNIENKTIFTGFKPNVRDYQSLMDVCVFPSKNEPFGLVAIETLSLCKPTIVFSDGGGIVEIVMGVEKDDIVYDIHSLSNRLEYYYLNRELIDKKNDIRKRHSKNYNISIMEEAFKNIYKRLL